MLMFLNVCQTKIIQSGQKYVNIKKDIFSLFIYLFPWLVG